MAFLDRLRPKPRWLHPDVEVRAAAVRQLSDRHLLLSVAREDAEPRVRRLALRKLGDASVLAERAAQDPDAAVREEACSLLLSFALESRDEAAASAAITALHDPKDIVTVAKAAPLEAIRRAALARLTDARALAAVAKGAEDASIRLTALERIEDPGAVGDVALRSEHKDTALAAVERVDQPELLKAVAARARSRAAAKRAHAMLQARPSAPAPASGESRRSEQLGLCAALELLASSEDWGRVERELEGAEAAWERLQPADAELEPRFAVARGRLRERLSQQRERRALEERRDQGQSEAVAERVRLCEALESLSGEGALERLEAVRGEWERLPVVEGEQGADLTRRFEQAQQACRRRAQASAAEQARRSRMQQVAAELEQAVRAPTLAEAHERVAAPRLEWERLRAVGQAEPDAAARVQEALRLLAEREAQEREGRLRREQENLARLQELAGRLEALATSPEPPLRDAERGLREARAALEEPGPLPSKHARESVWARLRSARAALYGRAQELREADEWKRWANLGLQEELCRKAEALQQMEDLDAASRQLRALDEEWKQVRQAPKEEGEALWLRFKAARDQVRARCEAHFAHRLAEQRANLQRKQELCEKAEALAESTDWIRTAEALKALQADWKQIGPAPRAQAQAVWERFRRACDRFFNRRHEDLTRRKADWAENLKRKEALCEQAEAQADSSDWEAAAAAIRRLQSEWRTIGPVRKSRSEAVWQRFRSACDRFFERYRRRDDLDRAAKRSEAEEVCRELEALLSEAAGQSPPAAEGLATTVQELISRWRRSGTSEKEDAALHERFARARDRLLEAHPSSFHGTELDPEANRLRLEKLCTKVERLLPPEPAASPGQALADRLRDALATNTMGGRAEAAARWKAAAAEVDAARTAWKRVGSVPGEAGRLLNERFEQACRRFFAQRPPG